MTRIQAIAAACWLATVLAIVGVWLIFAFSGCGATQAVSDTASAESCWDRVNAAIQAAPSCKAAVAAVNATIQREPACAVVTHALTLVCDSDDAGDAGDGGPDAD
jgi:hypothetical protein